MNKVETKIVNILHHEQLLEQIACWLLLISLIVLPAHVRYAMLSGQIKAFARINYLFIVALIIMLYIRNQRKQMLLSDFLISSVWFVCLWLALYSDYKIDTASSTTFIAGCMLPVCMLLYRFQKDTFLQFINCFLQVFNIFIVILLVIALLEKFSGDAILRTINMYLQSKEYASYLEYIQTDVWRFYSLWGHALTNATLFNVFFIMNDLYHNIRKTRYPKLIYFAIALLGVLLCSSKTAIIILFAYFLLTSWKNKKLLIGCGVIVIVFLVCGGFRILLQRFTGTPLTTGRFDAFGMYLQSGVRPLQLFRGYGTGVAYSKALYQYRAGFEFPVLMEALDYGILFAIIWIGGIYVYVSWRLLRARCIMVWIGFSAIYTQFNTYNGLALSNQDSFIWLCVVTMLLLNLAELYGVKNKKRDGIVIETDAGGTTLVQDK